MTRQQEPVQRPSPFTRRAKAPPPPRTAARPQGRSSCSPVPFQPTGAAISENSRPATLADARLEVSAAAAGGGGIGRRTTASADGPPRSDCPAFRVAGLAAARRGLTRRPFAGRKRAPFPQALEIRPGA